MQTSILSFPKRGSWGDWQYRGNCSGYIIQTLLNHYRPESLVDPTEGSGTSGDVAREMRVKYTGLDLRSGYDLLTEPLSNRIEGPAEMIFVHPPYHDIIRYSGKQWGNEPHPNDLSRCSSYNEFLAKLQLALMNIYNAVSPGGRIAILIGDIRRNGNYYSPQAAVQQFHIGKLEAVIIKAQHNTHSATRSYSGRFIRIGHEYLLIFRK